MIPRASLLLLALVACSAPALAQASLEVVVRDGSSGHLVVGAEVRLENASVGFSATASTNAQGKVRFLSLSTAGEYSLTVRAGEAYQEGASTGIVLRTDSDHSVAIPLTPRASFSESIDVAGVPAGVATVNTINAEVSSTLREGELNRLPIEGRDLSRSFYRLPHVTQATAFFAEAPSVSLNGANPLFTNYMVDGLDNNESFLGGQKFAIPTGFVQDVTVLTSSYSTELGRSGTGIVNVTTKSGGNSLHGEAFYLTRPGQPLDSESDFASRDLSGNAVKDGFERHQLGFAIGGPMRRDRTFYFVNGEATADDKDNLLSSPRLGVSETVPGENEFGYYSARIDHRWDDRFTSSVRANVGDVEVDFQGGGIDGGVTFPSAGSTRKRDSGLYAVKTNFVGDDWVGETNLQLSHLALDFHPRNPSSPQATVLGADGLTAAVLGHPGTVFDETEQSWQVQQKVEVLHTNHTLKAGVELVSSEVEALSGGNVNGSYLVRLTAAQEAEIRALGLGSALDVEDIPADVSVLRYDVELRTTSIGARQNIWSVYAEELWSASSRLNVTAGLRWDYDDLSRGAADAGDDDNFAPRLAINYQLDDKGTVRAGAGVFYDKLIYDTYHEGLRQSSTSAGFRSQIEELIALGILPADTDLERVFFDGNVLASLTDVPYLGGPTGAEFQGGRESAISTDRRILSPWGYDNPVTEQYTLGYQRQIARDQLFYVDLIHARSFNLYRQRDLNSTAPYPINDPANVIVRTPAQADASRPIEIVPGGGRNLLVSEGRGEARYSAANFTLLKNRRDSLYSYQLSYTLSQTRNNNDNINFRPQDANDFDAEWGPALNDRTHVVSGFLQLFPRVQDLSFSLAVLAQSGQPINRIPDAQVYGTTDLNGDGRFFTDSYLFNSDRHPGRSRNDDRLPWNYVVDFGVQYRLPVLDRAIELRMDVFNVLDRQNLSGYSNSARQSNQIQVGPSGVVVKNAGPPRQFQFGARYTF